MKECPRCSRTGPRQAPIFMDSCPWTTPAGVRVRQDWICPRCGLTIIEHASGLVQIGQKLTERAA